MSLENNNKNGNNNEDVTMGDNFNFKGLENIDLNQLIKEIADIEGKLNNFINERYFNSQTILTYEYTDLENKISRVTFKISDILLLGAITQSSILISGSSGSGKTLLAELIMKFLFGEQGYTRKNITPDMNEQDFMDIDFGAIKEGKKLKESIIGDELFFRPGIIIDEANRAPPIVQNRLLQLLENNIDLKSKKIRAGIKLNSDIYYHWNILTLNYGEEYAGTSRVDRALKDRIVIEIPIDNFPPTLKDQILMIRRSYIEKEIKHIPKNEVIFKAFLNLNKIELSLEAEALILYLSSFSNCIKSPTYSKYGVVFSPQYCKAKDCSYARNPPMNNVCPFVFGPSNRVIRKLVHVSRGFYLLRQAKIINHLKKRYDQNFINKFLEQQNFEVDLQDIVLVSPLVLHSKISMNRAWVLNKYNGNLYLACKSYINIVYNQLKFFMNKLLPSLILEMKGEKLSEKDKGMLEKALKEDFHFRGLIEYVKKFLTL
ncbi:MAG: AAA family ATPase [Promethearchaeota archaeon]